MMKKILTLFAAVVLLGGMMTVQADDVYHVAGTPATIFGEVWTSGLAANEMTWDAARSLFVKEYTVTEAINSVELKAVKNNLNWYGDFLGNNVQFDLSGAGSFRVLFNATTGVASIEGAIVVPKSQYSVFAVGNGDGSWLNGIAWDPGAAANKMAEVEPNVWEITFNNVDDGNSRQIKFAVNGGWTVNFGGTFSSFGTATNAVSNGDNITFNSPGGTAIAARLDLRNCKASDKSGAKFTIANGALPDLHNCFVAGSATDIFGSAWDASAAANKMTWDAVAGKYSKTYTVTKAYKSVALKAVYDGVWYGDNGENVKFSLSEAGTFTVLFDKNTKEVTVEGTIVGPEQFDFEYVTATGNGSGNWLNGKNWNTDFEANRMTEVAPDIYEITYEDVPGMECQLKFTFNGGWDYEIGGVFEAFGTASAAVYGNTAGTITFNPVEDADVKIRLDLSNFNFATKEGATFTITQVLPPPPTIKMNGTFADGTTMEDTDPFVIALGDATASITLTLTAGDYDFKILSAGNPRSNGYTYHRDFTGATGIIGDNINNMKLEADADGDYTFTWTYETSALSIEFPEEPTPEYVTVKFFAPRTEENPWTNVYAFSWKKSRVFSDPWPGDNITNEKDGVWYTYSVRKGANLIFSDGLNTGGMQTNDIENIQSDVYYVSTAISNEKKVTVTEQNIVNYSIAGTQLLVGGDDDWAIHVALDASNQITFPNLANGTYEFKITNGTWAWSIGGDDHLMGGDCSEIAETAGIGNVVFTIDHTQDVTITYYPETEKICLGAETVLDPALAWNTTFAAARIGMENTLPWLNHYLTAGVVYTSSNPSVASFANENTYELTLNAAGKTTITANYYGNIASYKLDVYDFETPAKNIETIGGKFICNAHGDTVVFSRGNLRYDYGMDQWYCAEKQHDVLSDVNLHFGDVNYKGVIDLFSWSNATSNYGRLASNKDADFPGSGDFVDWGGLFAGDEKEWSTLSKDEWNYLMAHNNWTMIQITPTPVPTYYDGFLCMVLFPVDWEAPAELSSLNYKFYNFDDEPKAAQNTFTMAQWESLFEANGAVLLPPAGARAGCVGNTWNGDAEATKGWNPQAGGWYDHVDNVGWYGYYWTGTQDPRADYQHCASYLILPGWSEGPTLADDDDEYRAPQVWSREKRRGNSVRLVTRIPRQEVVIRDGLNDGKWGTICPKQTVEFVTGAEFYQISYLEEQGGMPYNMVFDEISGTTLTAGQPYFFIATGAEIRGCVKGDVLTAAGAGVNGFYGYIGDAPKALNNWHTDYMPGEDNTYVIYNNMVTRLNGPTNLKSERCYININATEPSRNQVNPSPARRRITMSVAGEQVVTGMESLKVSDQPMKVMINGQLYILRGEKMYNANGQIVK